MPEVKTELKTYRVEYKCDECNEGYMRSTGETLLMYPPIYPHICDKCGYKEKFSILYPTVHYDEKGD